MTSLAIRPAQVISQDGIYSFNPHDRLFIHHFEHYTAREMSGRFKDDFWSSLVLQVAQRELSVRHMTIALAHLHRCSAIDSTIIQKSTSTYILRQQAVNHYVAAVGLLNRHIVSRGWASVEVILICSILCITFEWLRGYHDAGKTHLRSSLNILRQLQKKSSARQSSTALSSPSGYLIRKTLCPLFMRLVLQAATFNLDPTLSCQNFLFGSENTQQTVGPAQARDGINRLLIQTYFPAGLRLQGSPMIQATNESNFVARLAKWSSALSNMSTSDMEGTELQLWHMTAQALLCTTHSDQMTFDGITACFTTILALAESLRSSRTPAFSLDIAIIPPLFITAIKCRHPRLRRQAIGLLQVDPWREGLWDSAGAAKVAGAIVAAEEEMAKCEVLSEKDIPAWARVQGLQLHMEPESSWLTLRTIRQGAKEWDPCRMVPLQSV